MRLLQSIKSAIGIAMAYTMTRWKELSNYLMVRVLEIDNTAIANKIRPVAGREKLPVCGIAQCGTAGSDDQFFF